MVVIVENPIDINDLDNNEITNLKNKLNALLGDRQNDIQLDFDHDKFYYDNSFLIYKTKIDTLNQLKKLKLILPLIEASVKVNKALRELKLSQTDENLLNLYNAQNLLKLKIEDTLNDNKHAIDNGELYVLRLKAIVLIAFLLGITILVTLIVMESILEPQFPIGSYLILTWLMSCVPSFIALGVGIYFENTHGNEMQIYIDFLPTKTAFENRNRRFASDFKSAEKFFQNKKPEINNEDTINEEEELFYGS